ncbi:alkane 1-monooxygenase [Rubellimicrobium thermophilum DSM 16684]|uniref:Alkane 1-monooxygenase n=1 Tax=Rubellimicrobium thermophilum DSM 16684 TaxID=1123069 RepID=S9QYY4_9RHOB|nr:alkane 1-monooxygenase [Rubellimicrobium thermophilum]EPX84873.1 alkane 1-monooxygenase [Rubellimicrobium thermophilum DSM 16684]
MPETATAPPPPRHAPIGFWRALPYWMSLLTLPLAWAGAWWGGWTVFLLPLFTWFLFDLLDLVIGLDTSNADPSTPDSDLFWYRLVTLIWWPLQALTVFGLVWYVPQAPHLGLGEKLALFFGIGIVSGAVGIVYAHELMHQSSRLERWLADLLLAQVLYSHFRSEHLRVHHIHVGTPRDPVSARYNEGFHRFFLRVLRQCPPSAWRAEKALLARAGLPVWSRRNPFWRYAVLQAAALALALALGGWEGLGLFLLQAFVAIWQLELTNYIEHYGLTRKHLGEGRYEPVRPRHSWNAAHRASNWFLINLQRHSDHHYKPDRRFPLLQTYDEDEAPQLPYGYPLMAAVALVPPLWRRMMNPRVRAWRRRFYPEVTDWTPYRTGALPMPRGS